MKEQSKTAPDVPALPSASDDLTSKAGLNAAAALLDYGARVLVSLLLNPFLLTGLGPVLYGVWQTMLKMINYLTTADGRPTQALKWIIANAQSEEDPSLKRKAIGSTLLIWLMFSPLIIVGGGLLVWVIPDLIHVPAEYHAIVRIATLILVIDILVTGIAGVPEAVLRGMNLGYKRMGLMTGVVILGGVLTGLVVHFGGGLVGIALVQGAMTIFTGIIYWVITQKNLPWFGVEKAVWSDVKRFLSYSAWLFVAILVNRFIKVSDVIVLGIVSNPVTVTIYTITSYAAAMTINVLTIVISAVLPGMGKFLGERDFVRAAALRREMLGLTWLVATALGAAVLVWNRSFVTLWTSAKYYAGHFESLLLVLVAVQLVVTRNDDNILDVSLDVKRKTLVSGTSTVLASLLAAFWGYQYGIIGLCAGLLTGRLVMMFFYPALVARFFGLEQRAEWVWFVRPGLATLVIYGAAYAFAQQLLATNWLMLLLAGGLTTIAALLIAWYLGLSGDLRRQLSGRLLALAGRTPLRRFIGNKKKKRVE